MSLESTNLSALLQRLESATTRLETIATEKAKAATEAQGEDNNEASDDDLEDDTPSLRAFDEQVGDIAKSFLEDSKVVGDIVAEQGILLEKLVSLQRVFIKVAAQTKKPQATQFRDFLKSQEEAIKQITDIKEKNRRSPYFNHACSVVDGIPAFGWVAVEKTPVPYIRDFKDAAQFYGNRVRKAAKEKGDAGQPELNWLASYSELLASLESYVKEFHRTGVLWNPKGLEPTDALKYIKKASGEESDQGEAAAGGSAPPPPPPPPPPPVMTEAEISGATNKPSDESKERSALLSDLNRGSDVTASLRKVDKSQMTHKNPNLRGNSIVPSTIGKSTSGAASSSAQVVSRPPKMTLEGKKWVVENYKDEQLTIEIEDIKYTVYIYNCTGCTIQVKNKLNTITVDSCKSTGVVFDAALSEAVIVNSRSIEVQVVNTVPAVSIDKSDSINLYLSKETIDQTTITSAKSSSINVSFPVDKVIDGENVEENEELPIPEQIQTVIKDNKLVSSIYEHVA